MKSYIWFIVAAILIVIAFFIVRSATQETGSQAETSPTPSVAATVDSQTAESSLAPEDGTESPEATVHTVAYDGTSFSPSTLTIKQGDKVEFKNVGSGVMHPASNDHPDHTEYPEFDANREVPAGESYTFEFEKVGSWGFHDHENPDATGMITVE